MALSAEKKNEIVKEFQLGDNDTGSPEVQVALLSQIIDSLQEQFFNKKCYLSQHSFEDQLLADEKEIWKKKRGPKYIFFRPD